MNATQQEDSCRSTEFYQQQAYMLSAHICSLAVCLEGDLGVTQEEGCPLGEVVPGPPQQHDTVRDVCLAAPHLLHHLSR